MQFLLLSVAIPATLSASDTLLVHGHIYTGNTKAPWAEAIAVSGEKIDAVGTGKEILARRDARTIVVDLHGKTVIAGITDSHMHVLFGAMALHGINLSTPEASITQDSPEALTEKIRAYAVDHAEEKILFGRADFGTVPPGAPSHQLLDRAVPDRPLIVHNTSEHALWLNGKALAMAGIGTPVADPREERYVIRDASGHPTGILLEDAMEIAERAAQAQISRDEKLAMLRDASRYLNRLGITSITNATGSLADIELYAALHDRGELTVRARTSFGSDWPCTWPPDPFVGMQQAVTRTVWRNATSSSLVGGVFDGAAQGGAAPTLLSYVPEERLTVEQAVNAYTRGSAYANFTDDLLGTLESGKLADLVVLSQDIFSAPHEQIGKTQVMLTMVGGKIVFNEMQIADLRPSFLHGWRAVGGRMTSEGKRRS
jgi:predicted amidohydrolase YtcJ